jgi:hypothetical protein
VIADNEKCQSVTLYCSQSVTEFIQALESYNTPDWNLLKKDIKDFYDADFDITRYKVKDLITYVKKQRKSKWELYLLGKSMHEALFKLEDGSSPSGRFLIWSIKYISGKAFLNP